MSKTTARIILGLLAYIFVCWLLPYPFHIPEITYLEAVVAGHLAVIILAGCIASLFVLAYLLDIAFPTED
jgi:hypothetical protein